MADDLEGGGRAADPYQAKYMGGASLFHDKISAPLAYHLLFLLPILTVLATSLTGKAPLLVLGLASIPVLVLWALFSTLRISVSNREVFVQYGLFGPKIPVESIERCEAVDYDWKKYGGWGIRYGSDGSVAYNMMGDGGRAVRVTYRKGKKTQVVLLGSRDPERLAAAIAQARAAAASSAAPAGPVRIAASPEPEPAAIEEQAEEEATAEKQARR